MWNVCLRNLINDSIHNNIEITSFLTIKNTILFAPKPSSKFGKVKEKIMIEISKDEFKAYLILCVSEKELFGSKKSALIQEIAEALSKKGIVFGVKWDLLEDDGLVSGKQILIAEGLPPVNGTDSEITLFQIKESKPEVREDGAVDFYELNLINRVYTGDWLGERKNPTAGTSGKSVTGKDIAPLPGRMYPLIYNHKTIEEIEEDRYTKLYSLLDGAVNFNGDTIEVSNHIELAGDVDFKTGNICLTVMLLLKVLL